MNIVDALGNVWEDISTPRDDSWPNRTYKKTRKAAILKQDEIRDIPARTFIQNNVDPKYATKLLKGLDSYLRRNNINYHQYRLLDLQRDINTLSKQRGVGQVSINHLREAIDRYEN